MSGDHAPKTAGEALARARRHARRAIAETLAAAHALLEAGSIGATGLPAEGHPRLQLLARSLDEASRRMRSGDHLPGPAVNALLDALDAEIARWEARSAGDPDARAVLRTFLSLRELLWEFGLRREAREGKAETPPRSEATPPHEARRSARGRPPGRRPRVQRVEVQG